MPADDIYRRNPARDLEVFACRVVGVWLADRGTAEDTSRGSGPDFEIHYGDGRKAVGEVGWHEDPALREMWANTFRRDRHQVVDLPEGSGTWTVHLVLGAHIGRLYNQLPAFIVELDAIGCETLDIYESWPHGPTADTARSLGIEHMSRFDGNGPDQAMFFMPGKGGVVPTDPNVIADWIEDMLADPGYWDTTEKLLALEADERHVFIMAGGLTPFGAEERLRRLDQAMPSRPLTVPEGITHVWAMGQYGGTLAAMWNADGWLSVTLPDPEAIN